MFYQRVFERAMFLFLLLLLFKYILIIKNEENLLIQKSEKKCFNQLNRLLSESKKTIDAEDTKRSTKEKTYTKPKEEDEIQMNKDRILKKAKKRLLIYTPLFGKIPWPHVPYDYNFTELDQSPCQENRCELTYNTQDIKASDAVLFHARDLPHAQVLRKIRDNPDQIWIWVMNESPMFTYLNLSSYNGIFNWTATYRTDSEIFLPYYGIQQLQENDPIIATENFAQSKDKKILYITSHCDDTRLNFVRNLKKYIAVDVYGACAKFVQTEVKDCQINSKSCEELKGQYKFVLAIENSFCIDYVTEKYYQNGLLGGILPIVAGGANYSNPKIAISKSFINIRDYKNITELVSYLNYLDKNDESYNTYFQWKRFYKVELQMALCKVCKALWEGRPKRTTDLEEFWSIKNSCYDEADQMKDYY